MITIKLPRWLHHFWATFAVYYWMPVGPSHFLCHKDATDTFWKDTWKLIE